MLIKTHLAISIFFILLLLPFVNNKIIFVILALLSTYIPDLDLSSSKLGKKKVFRPIQFFVSHRGFFHSFSFLFLMTFLLLLFLPLLALGFFVGYSSHLFADCFTPLGIYPFYPWKRKSTGRIHTGGRKEMALFVVSIFLDLFLFSKYIFAS